MTLLINYSKIFYNKIINKFIGLFKRLLLKFNLKSILEKNFKINKPFVFVQVGANDGVSFDFLYDFVVLRKSSGIVIEPIKEYYDELIENYINFDGIIKVNKAIHPIEKQLSIYKINPTSKSKYPDWVKGIASFNLNHHKNLNINTNDIVTETVDCDTLMNIVNIDNIDYFQIDTEGFDFEVLKMIDFKIIKPKIIKYEHVSLSLNDKNKAKELLIKHGYFIFSEQNDTIALKSRIIKI